MKHRVVIVEDEAISAIYLKEILRRNGFETVKIFSRGEDAVEMTPALAPDLVLMDIRLAGEMDGIEAAFQIVRKTRVPVIFTTAHTDSNTLRQARRVGPYGFLFKPVREHEILPSIEAALHLHALEEENRHHRERLVEQIGERTRELEEANVLLRGEAEGHRRALDSLGSAYSTLSAALESTTDGILIVDSLGRLLLHNRRFAAMWKIPEDLLHSTEDDKLLEFAKVQLRRPEKFMERVRDLYDHPMDESDDVIEFADGRIFQRYSRPQVVGGEAVGRVWSFRDISEPYKDDKTHRVLYQISEAAHDCGSPEELYPKIHEAFQGIFPVDNFYIAILDAEDGVVHFPYFRDEFDPQPPPRKMGNGLTEYVIRTGRTVLVTPESYGDLSGREGVQFVGKPPLDWLGVPLKVGDLVIGAMAIQTYDPAIRYGQREAGILKFVSSQVGMVIGKKRAEATLRESERRLHTALEKTEREVAERKSTEDKLRASLEEKEILLREVHHRVKNNLTIVVNLLNLQKASAREPQTVSALDEALGRVLSMLSIYRQLNHFEKAHRIQMRPYISELLSSLVQSTGNSAVEVKAEVHDVVLNVRDAVACGLIVTELFTNAHKHAFPDNRPGVIALSLTVEGDPVPATPGTPPRGAVARQIVLSFRNDGVDLPAERPGDAKSSLGMKLVSMLSGQLKGSLEISRGAGVEFRVRFPHDPADHGGDLEE